jgi:hypothetical protein
MTERADQRICINAPAHSTAVVQAFITKQCIIEASQHPYGPDLIPCDFGVFPKLTSPLKMRRMVNATVTQYTSSVNGVSLTDWLAPQDSDCSRKHSKVSSDRLQSYIKATLPVLEIFEMAGYFPDRPRISLPTLNLNSALGCRLLRSVFCDETSCNKSPPQTPWIRLSTWPDRVRCKFTAQTTAFWVQLTLPPVSPVLSFISIAFLYSTCPKKYTFLYFVQPISPVTPLQYMLVKWPWKRAPNPVLFLPFLLIHYSSAYYVFRSAIFFLLLLHPLPLFFSIYFIIFYWH